MNEVDWSEVEIGRKPTKKQRKLYWKWFNSLKNSDLTHEEKDRKAKHNAERGKGLHDQQA